MLLPSFLAENRLLAQHEPSKEFVARPRPDGREMPIEKKNQQPTERALRALRVRMEREKLRPENQERLDWYDRRKEEIDRDVSAYIQHASAIEDKAVREAEILRFERMRDLYTDAFDSLIELQVVPHPELQRTEAAKDIADPIWYIEGGHEGYRFAYVPKIESIKGVPIEREALQVYEVVGKTDTQVGEIVAGEEPLDPKEIENDRINFKPGELTRKLHVLLAGPLQAIQSSQKKILRAQ